MYLLVHKHDVGNVIVAAWDDIPGACCVLVHKDDVVNVIVAAWDNIPGACYALPPLLACCCIYIVHTTHIVYTFFSSPFHVGHFDQ